MTCLFGIKYFSKEDANHLLQTLKLQYEGTEDWEGKIFCGFTFDWNYKEKYVESCKVFRQIDEFEN